MTLHADLPPDIMATGLNGALGFELEEAGPDRVIAAVTVGPQHLQPYGIVHGGLYCSIIESIASIGATLWFGDRGQVVGVNNNTNFLRSARGGRLTATATPIHRGRSQQLWQVEIVGDDARLAARGEVRLQNLAMATSQ